MSDILDGLLELASDVSHDPDEAEWFDTMEYLSDIPNPRAVLKELVQYIHAEYL